MTFKGFDKRVSKVVAEPRSLGVVRYGSLEKETVACYLETSCSSDPLWSARSKVAKDLSVYMAATTLRSGLTLPTSLDNHHVCARYCALI